MTKKILTGVIALSMVFSFVASFGVAKADTMAAAAMTSSASYNFQTNLTVGSRGNDVTALQQVLIEQGYLTISAPTGYFGSLTKAAVKIWQAKVGLPATGFFGPLSRGKINGTVVVTPATGGLCPNGMTLASNCTTAPSTTPSVTLCPNGMTLASNCSVAPSGTSTSTGSVGTVINDGTDGSLTVSQSSYVASGVQLKKGDTKDILAIRLKATSGGVTVTHADVHFNLRPWLVFSQLTLKDSSGKVIATKALSGASDATEVTVGTDYLVRFDNVNYTIDPATPNVDLVVGATVLSATDKITNGQIVNVAFGSNGLRTQNGKAYTDSIGGANISGSSAQTGVGLNNFTLSSTGSVADIYTRISPNSPLTRQQVTSLTQQTNGVTLGVFGLKSANNSSTLNTLTINLVGTTTPASVFSNVRLVVGGVSYGGILGTVSGNSVPVTFTNLNVALPQDVFTDLTVMADISSGVNNATTTVSLVSNATNIVVTDVNYNTATVEASTATSNVTTFTVNALQVANTSATLGSAIQQNNSTVGYNVNYQFTLNNTSNSDLFVSATSGVLVATSTTGTNGSSTLPVIQTVTPSTFAGDLAGVSYDIPAGSSRTFTLTGALRGTTGQTVNLKVTQINYGTAASTPTGSNINFGLENLVTTASF